MISAILLLGVMAFAISGLFFAISTYKAAKDRDWEAAAIGVALAGICLFVMGGIALLLVFSH